ncbi:MAG: hypothetical protein ACKOAH_06875, partial [Pirellula sp.]
MIDPWMARAPAAMTQYPATACWSEWTCTEITGVDELVSFAMRWIQVHSWLARENERGCEYHS